MTEATTGFKDVSELDKYADEYPDKGACMKWVENGVAFYILNVQTFESAQEREETMKMVREMMGDLIERMEELTGKPFAPMALDFYNGYCRFKEMPLSGTSFQNFVPVHGGITYGRRSEDGSYVYGFDTNHGGDSVNPDIKSTDWLKAQTEKMAFGITAAVPYEKEHMAAKNSDERIQVVQKYYDYVSQECDASEISMGAILTLLCDRDKQQTKKEGEEE